MAVCCAGCQSHLIADVHMAADIAAAFVANATPWTGLGCMVIQVVAACIAHVLRPHEGEGPRNCALN